MDRSLFTVVVPMFNSERYLAATLRSLDWQTYPLSKVEVILVDDGSTDGSVPIAEAWARGKPNVTVIQQPNGGPAAARNQALAVATGEWFASVDSDDILDRDYFLELASIIERDSRHVASAVFPRLWMINERTGRWTDGHALGEKFRYGDRLVRLRRDPSAFALSSTSLLKTDVLRENGLSYDAAVRPTFEDAHLIGRYLACFPDPVVAIASRARYYYRRRLEESDSLTQSTWSQKDNYTVVPRAGFLDMLTKVRQRLGRVPVWAQNMVLYNLMWFLIEEQALESKTAWVDHDTAQEFQGLLDQIMGFIDVSTIEVFPFYRLSWEMRQALIVHFKDDKVRPRTFGLAKRGCRSRAVVLYGGAEPQIKTYSNALERDAVIVEERAHTYFGQEWMTEVSLGWDTDTPAATRDSLWINGVPAVLGSIRRSPKPPHASHHRLEPAKKRSKLATYAHRGRRLFDVASLTSGRSKTEIFWDTYHRWRASDERKEQAKARAQWVDRIKREAATEAVRQRYAKAWVVMDRVNTADDNGEHLYRHLMSERPDVNAYFFLARTSPHWDRLAAEGFRLVGYDSDEAALITLNSVARVSSDAVGQCMYPISQKDFGKLPGIFVFLQHGVLEKDISRWLRGKPIDLMTTSIEAEYLSIAGPHSQYTLERGQVELLGLTRWDKLLRLHRAQQTASTIIVAPTWRQDLARAMEGCQDQAARYELFEQSEYGKGWLRLLRGPTLAATGKQVQLILHPNMNALVPELDLPAHVTQLVGANLDYQQALTQAAALVTDFSSLAFDAAYIGIPIVYYQFDRADYFSKHTVRQGYFSYEDDGLGPVALDDAAASAAIQEIADNGFVAVEPYLSRVRRTFCLRDTNNCLRTVAAIESRLKED